ncbi:MAG: hypothetical protein J6Y19_00865, partial [Kiritimatiellae bacterium]|nr:hypothetical protein [Kiritimatiellia bacterium]
GTVSIEGGILTLGRGTEAACIGGGSYGAGGDVAISGGTILLREYTSAPIPNSIGRGHSSTGSDGTLTITGGSLGEIGSSGTRALDLSLLGSAPTNAAGEAVYSVTVTNLAPDAEAIFEGLPSWYGTNAIVADAGGNVYLWLPDGSYAFSAGTGEWMYAAEVAGAATVAVLVPPVYTVTWQNDDGTLLATNEVVAGNLPVYEGETPAKPADAQFTYTFAGWDPEVVAATTDTVYTVTYTATTNVYEITWANDDGTALATNQVLYGETPVYEGETPSKAETAQYSYAFAGWTPAPEAVTTNAIYTASYTPSLRIYTVKFEDDDGTELSSADYPYGTSVADIAVPDDPEKAATAEFTYTFAGWDPEVAGVTTDAVYTATYTAVTNVYEITWIVDGAEERETYAYGAMPSHDDPVKDPDDEYFYVFLGWTPDVTNVTGQAAYTAVFDEIAKTGVSVDGVDAAAGSGERWTYDSESAVLALMGGCVLSGSNTEGRVQVVVLADVALTASNLTL